MNAKDLVDLIISRLVAVGIAPAAQIFARKVWAQNIASGVWSVQLLANGQSSGGSNANFKLTYNIAINGYDEDASNLYNLDTTIRKLILTLPNDDTRIIGATTTPPADIDQLGAEIQPVQWVAQITTLIPNWEV